MNTSLWLLRSCECLQEAQPRVECSRRHSPRPCGSQRGPPHGPAQGLQCLSSLRVCVFSIKEIWEAACRAVLWEPGHRSCVSVILAGPAVPGSGARAGHTRKALALVCFQNLDVPVMGDNSAFSLLDTKELYNYFFPSHILSNDGHSRSECVCQLVF